MTALYPWVKTLHLVFVIGWMAVLFYLPRILVNLAEVGTADGAETRAVRARLLLMGRRLARFGQVMFGVMALLGLWLWFGFGMVGGWLHAKLTLVALLFAYGVWMARLLAGAESGRALPSSKTLRWINELPLLLLIPIVWLVIAKPF